MAYTVNGILFLHKVKLMRIWFFLLCESCDERIILQMNILVLVLKTIFINVPNHILVASLTLMALL